MLPYVLSGTMAGFGGILISSRLSSGRPTAAMGLEFDVIVASILGGVSLAGGEGSVIGTLVGALILGVINNGLNILGVEPFWQTILQGLILVIAVSIDIVLRGSGSHILRRIRGARVRPGG
jgi:ribose transport system permease protein